MQLFLAKRILLTISYTEQFSFPLTISELYSRLLVDYKISKKDFLEAILFLLKNNLINYFNGYLFIVGLDINNQKQLSGIRRKRSKLSEKKWKEVDLFLKFAKYVPFISGIAITGSLAVNNIVKDDDIDFLIVTKANRLWITRIIMVLFATLVGKRRSFAKEEKNSWCFNLWVEESDLQMPKGSRSAYEAYEVAQAVWVINKENVAEKFINLNKWAKKYVYSYNLMNQKIQKSAPILTKNNKLNFYFNDLFFVSQTLDFINLLLFYFQYLYMKPHMTREKVSKTHAFFHPRDTKGQITNKWEKSLLRVLQ